MLTIDQARAVVLTATDKEVKQAAHLIGLIHYVAGGSIPDEDPNVFVRAFAVEVVRLLNA